MQWRLTFIATGIVALIFCVGVLGLYELMHRMALDGLEERGSAAAYRIADEAREGAPPGELLPEVPGYYLLQVVDRNGRVVASSPALRGRPAMAEAPVPGRDDVAVSRIIRAPGYGMPLYATSVRVSAPGDRYLVVAATPMSDLYDVQETFARLAVVVMPVVLAGVWVIVWRSVGRALRPFDRMRRELSQITGGCMSRRVTVPDADDEVAGLAFEVNITLDRLQRFVEGQRKFVADASHELRSPLTALRTQLEVALAHPEDEDWPAVAMAALSDADRLQRVVTDVLTLAKLDAGVRGERQPVDLGELARSEATERLRRVPVHVHVQDVAHPVIVHGSRTQLIRVLTNLLDNAERHARSQIRIVVYRDGPDAVLEVADDGSGIPAQDRERVFQRFTRLPESRERDAHGSGLGLPIARDIVTAHGGTLTAGESKEGGALLMMRLPLKDGGPSGP
ncbi:sensor histidine kinase [Thermomonospora amylolytica]|uniref:sensor histidine kinase n=1 Tax=Thermomonospora amylolytica TaxID=1411117 RepID=UPI000E6C3193|nr:HAMP domain-containing sensor histidine kinase [Thermomonospora amylolytica]